MRENCAKLNHTTPPEPSTVEEMTEVSGGGRVDVGRVDEEEGRRERELPLPPPSPPPAPDGMRGTETESTETGA